MTDTLNVNVLVAAKEEYTKQLITTLKPGIYEIINGIFEDSQTNNKKLSISYSNFQIELKNVPSWSEYKIESKLNNINTKYPYLMDLITAIFVSHVKILACVRLKSEDKSIKIKVPKLNTFLHKILINCCETIYYKPKNIDKDTSFEIIEIATVSTIANQIPIQFILSEYLSGVFDEEQGSEQGSEQVIEPDPEPEPDVFDHIPIVPIESQDVDPDIKSFDELKDNIQKESIKVNKEDDVEELSDEEPDEELDEEPDEVSSEDSDEEAEAEVKEVITGKKHTLF
jgi:hypothetical protein